MNHRHAFSLIELLVVISIIAVLASMLLSAIPVVKSAARRINCAANLRQIGTAIFTYTEDWQGILPPARDRFPDGDHHWHNTIAPLLVEEAAPYDAVMGNYLSLVHNVIRGCPEWKTISNTNMGYSINKRPLSPQVPNICTNLNESPPITPLGVVALSRVSLCSRRVLIGEGKAWNLDISPTAPKFWSGRDDTRHHGRPNWLLFDGHVESFDNDRGAQDVQDPSVDP